MQFSRSQAFKTRGLAPPALSHRAPTKALTGSAVVTGCAVIGPVSVVPSRSPESCHGLTVSRAPSGDLCVDQDGNQCALSCLLFGTHSSRGFQGARCCSGPSPPELALV